MTEMPRAVIVGGGFGGLNAARRLGPAPVRVTVVDRQNCHLFEPLLYQEAAGRLSPANIAAPLRSILRRHKNTQVVLAAIACRTLGADFLRINPADAKILLLEGGSGVLPV